MAVSVPSNSIGDRRRAPVAFALGALVAVVTLAATQIGLVVTLVALQHHHYGYAAIGVASALATPISGLVSWHMTREQRTGLQRTLIVEASMLIVALAVTLSWAAFVVFALDNLP